MEMITFEKLIPEVKDFIFDYFTGKELIELSLVSNSWYEHIADSRKLMRKIKINISGNTEMSEHTKELLKNSKRKYQNLSVARSSPLLEKAVEILSAPGRRWKTIYIHGLNFRNNQHYEQMLSYVEKTVQEIHFDQVRITEFTTYDNEFKFPKIESLKLYDCDGVVTEPFQFTTSLTEFYLDYQHINLCNEAFCNILLKNNGIKIVSLPGSSFELLLEKNVIDHIGFQIECLIVSNVYNRRSYSLDRHNLDYFLKAQSKSIKKLFLADWMGIEILETVYEHLKILEELVVTNIDYSDKNTKWSNFHPKTNNAILSLNFQDKTENVNIFNAFTNATPMLKILKTYSITQEFLDFGFDKLQHLETLTVTFLDAKEIRKKNILPKLKYYSGIIYDHNLQTSITSKTRAQRSHFESILFDNFSDKCRFAYYLTPNIIHDHIY